MSIDVTSLSFSYGSREILHDLSFSIPDGCLVNVLGPNGVGKSTLFRCILGLSPHYSGTILVNGKDLRALSVRERAREISYIPQSHAPVYDYEVVDVVLMATGNDLKMLATPGEAQLQRAHEALARIGIEHLAHRTYTQISGGEQQLVLIARAIAQNARTIIMDEPTAVLTPQETEELFEQLILLRNSGHSIIFISHKLEEVKRICTRVTVLRHGYCLGSYDLKDMSEADISRLMVGRDVVLKIEKDDPTVGKTVLKIRNLVKNSASGKRVLDDVSFDIHEGEVIGIAGVEGNGQSALSDVLAGMESFSSGTVELNGHDIKGKNVHEIRQMGLAYIPEDRMQYGCAGDMSIRDNIIADRYFKKEYRNGLFINHKHIDEIVDQYIKDFEIACDDKREPVRMLSGGNIQKVVVAREFTSGSNFILANQPTRGIDVGAAEMIRKTIVKKSREEGTATLLISADLNEVLECSDRLLVMRKGKVVAAFRKANEVSEEELGEYMLGLKTMTPEEMEGLL